LSEAKKPKKSGFSFGLPAVNFSTMELAAVEVQDREQTHHVIAGWSPQNKKLYSLTL